MTKRHQDQLTARLEDAYMHGCTFISWDELYLWFDVQKIAAGTYRDLQTRWEDLTDGNQGRLMKIESRGGIHIFGESTANPVADNSTSGSEKK